MKKIFFLFFITFFTSIAVAAVPPTSIPVDNYAILEGSPARIAADSSGKLYVTNNTRGLINVFSNNGILLKSINTVESPLGIAVDSAGKIYVSDIEKKNVGVYDPNGSLLLKLGSGDAEFGLPNDIAVSSSGNIYVTDSINNVVKVYSPSGANLFIFGAGLLSFPTGISMDDGAGEVFVIDHRNNYIRIYDLNGNLKRSIKGSGGMMGGGKLLRPLGLAIDSTRMYVTDIFHSVVAAYDKVSGVFLKYIGNYGSGSGEFKTPIGLAMDKDNKIFIANNENQRIEVLGIDIFNSLKTDPNTINISSYNNGSLITQSVKLTSTIANTAWTAVVSNPRITLSSVSGTTPASVNVIVNPAFLKQGIYTSTVKFITPSGTESILLVNLEIRNPSLSVAPSSINFVYQKNSNILPSGSIMINSTGATLGWNASVSAVSWLKLSSTPTLNIWQTSSISGNTPSSIQVLLTDYVKYLPAGAYEAVITVNAGAVQGSPALVKVHLDVVESSSIKVTTNLDNALFTITGPENFSGSGKTWVAENVKTGTYSISFSDVDGYKKPADRTFTVKTGETAEIEGIYTSNLSPMHIIAGSADPKGNVFKIMSLDGLSEMSIIPFGSPYDIPSAVKVAAGDLDGDGIDEIVVTNGKNIIKIYRPDGNKIASKYLSGFADKLEIALADIDDDGKAEILAGYVDRSSNSRSIVSFGLNGNLLTNELYLMFRPGIVEPFTLTSGDIDGDGKPELIIADRFNLTAYRIINTFFESVVQIWSRTISEAVNPVITTGDIDGDGIDEICFASGPNSANPSRVRFLKGNGTDYGLQFDAFGDLSYMYGATVSLADIDGDGISEIAVGAGPGSSNEALIRLFESDGQFINQITALDTLYGVNISFGRFDK